MVLCDWASLVMQLHSLGPDGSHSRTLNILRFTKLGHMLRVVDMLRTAARRRSPRDDRPDLRLLPGTARHSAHDVERAR